MAYTLNDCQFLVKSFRRFACLRRLVESILLFYPDASILIADDSLGPGCERLPDDAIWCKSQPNVRWFQLPSDCGLPAARNYLVGMADRPVIINCDDDFVFTDETEIEKLLDVLNHDPSIGLVAGVMRQDGRVVNYTGQFAFAPDGGTRSVASSPPYRRLTIATNPGPPETTQAGTRFVRCDLALNFFTARREAMLRARWDPRLKVSWEHLDHFLEMHRVGIKVAYTPDVVVDHYQDRSPEYLRFRGRRQEYTDYVLQKWRLTGPPNHSLEPERWHSGSPLSALRSPLPNIVVLAIGHSGTSPFTAMLGRLGWHLGPVDEYAELPAVREINERLWRGRPMQQASQSPEQVLRGLRQPWAIKDPRFVHTLSQWIKLIEPYEPTLVWLQRPLDQVERSFLIRREGTVRDGEIISRGKTLRELWLICQQHYDRWPWQKLTVWWPDVATMCATIQQLVSLAGGRLAGQRLLAAADIYRPDHRPGSPGWAA